MECLIFQAVDRAVQCSIIAAMPGRKPKPVALLKLEGGYRPDRHERRQYEPAAGGGLGDPPEWLTAEQQTLWHELAKTTVALGASDRSMFISFVLLTDTLRTANTAIPPDLKTIRQTSLAMARVAGELGFTPVARARLGTAVPTKESEEVPRFQKFDTLLPDGKVVRYRAPSGTRKTQAIS